MLEPNLPTIGQLGQLNCLDFNKFKSLNKRLP